MGTPLVIGTSYFAGVNLSGVTTVLAPASNTKGVWIKTLQGDAHAGDVAIHADTAAPSAPIDNTKRVLFRMVGAGRSEVQRDIFLPIGLGIYASGNGHSGSLQFTYEVL